MMEENTRVEEILIRAFEEMKKRYRDILDVSYSIREKKDDMKELLYLLDLRGQIITRINQVQETIRPVMEILNDKTGISIDDIYRENSSIRSIKENIREMILAIREIDDEIMDFIRNAQQSLQEELRKVRMTKKVAGTYGKKPQSGSRIFDSRR